MHHPLRTAISGLLLALAGCGGDPDGTVSMALLVDGREVASRGEDKGAPHGEFWVAATGRQVIAALGAQAAGEHILTVSAQWKDGLGKLPALSTPVRVCVDPGLFVPASEARCLAAISLSGSADEAAWPLAHDARRDQPRHQQLEVLKCGANTQSPWGLSYGLNHRFCANSTFPAASISTPKRLATFTHTLMIPVSGDVAGDGRIYVYTPLMLYSDITTTPVWAGDGSLQPFIPVPRHRGGINCGFLDGHVRWSPNLKIEDTALTVLLRDNASVH